MLPLYSVCVLNSSIGYKEASALGWHFTCTDMEDALTSISVQNVTVYSDLTF